MLCSSIATAKRQCQFGGFLSFKEIDNHPPCTKCRNFVCGQDKTCELCREWDDNQWQVFNKNKKKREWERFRKREHHKKKKATSSFGGFSGISSVSAMDEAPAPLRELVPGQSTPPVSCFQ